MLRLDGTGPLHRQTYRALRRAILEGELPPGARLPSTRALAQEAGLSRNTVLQAYDQLVAEGYAASLRGSGTYVAPELPDTLARVARRPELPRPAASRRPRRPAVSAWAERALHHTPPGGASWSIVRREHRFDFRYGEPAYADFPLATWCRVLSRRARAATPRELAYSPPGGAPELREALAVYLRRARGVACRPEQIVVVYGSQQAVDLTARVLVEPGVRVVLEDPHYTGFRLALAAAGGAIETLAVDAGGLPVDELAGLGDVRLACVTPSHQFPLGAVMPLSRRLELLDWAERADAWVLEDDYDSEFRYDGRPLECLQGLDRSGRVIYAGTVSKVMFPALRIGYLVVPDALLDAFLAAKAFADTGSGGLEQRALAEFIREGHFERHLRRSRTRNAARRRALLEAVAECFGEGAEIGGANAGLHVVLWLSGVPARAVPELRQRAAREGVGVYGIDNFYRRKPRRAGLLLGYASLTEDEIREGVRALARAAAALGRRAGGRGRP